MHMKETRTRFWVDPFQTKLFFRVAWYWLIYTVTLFNLLFAWRLVEHGSDDLWRQFVTTIYDNIPLFVTFLIAAPWIALDAARFANRLVGPLSRFRKTMHSVTVNEPVRPLRLRKDDFLTDMQADFNAMLEALEQRGAVHRDETAPSTQVGG
jgi:nitrogen fixation/metabolism regulation signal transduction histidine kinase